MPLFCLLLLGCDGGSGYEIVERPSVSLALAAGPGASDTLPTIAVAGEDIPYPCARLLEGVEAEWRVDTLLVTQREVPANSRRRPRVFCVPFNAAARTEGVERTAREYPAYPHGEQPGYSGWRVPGTASAGPAGTLGGAGALSSAEAAGSEP